MPIESATYISQLVASNPVHTDGLSQTDSHLRLIKTVMQASFPGIAGAVTASHTDLNTVTGLAASVTALKNATVGTTGAQIMNGPLTVSGSLSAASVQQNGAALVPSGVVVLWSGASTAIPTGWLICDGTHGTPNLAGMFVVGVGAGYTVGLTGGSSNPTGTTSTAGVHNHGGYDAPSGGFAAGTLTGTTDTQGVHNHTGNTANHTLVIAEMPSHNHTITNSSGSALAAGPLSGWAGSGTTTSATATTGGDQGHSHNISVDGSHSHNLVIGGLSNHQHSISVDGSHSHTVTINDGRPPFYALCYIMKS